MRAAICDDEGALAAQVEQLAARWGMERGRTCLVRTFASGEELLFETAGSYPFDLILLDIDLGVILGNLIDNAMESCEKVEEGQRFLRLHIGMLRQQLYLSISNATTETVRRIDAAYISAKRGNHGHGLKRIDRVVEKYGGYVNRRNEPGVFATEILLPL